MRRWYRELWGEISEGDGWRRWEQIGVMDNMVSGSKVMRKIKAGRE